jgi:hypothetical protein
MEGDPSLLTSLLENTAYLGFHVRVTILTPSYPPGPNGIVARVSTWHLCPIVIIPPT